MNLKKILTRPSLNSINFLIQSLFWNLLSVNVIKTRSFKELFRVCQQTHERKVYYPLTLLFHFIEFWCGLFIFQAKYLQTTVRCSLCLHLMKLIKLNLHFSFLDLCSTDMETWMSEFASLSWDFFIVPLILVPNVGWYSSLRWTDDNSVLNYIMVHKKCNNLDDTTLDQKLLSIVYYI